MPTTSESKIDKKKTDETRQIEMELRRHFPNTEAYRFNSASIRIRIIADCFKEKSNPDREDLVNPLLAKLPKRIQADITVLLLLAPDETKTSLMNLEFEDPHPSRL